MSYFGDAKFIKNKIENFSHQEHNLEHITDVDAIQKSLGHTAFAGGGPQLMLQLGFQMRTLKGSEDGCRTPTSYT